MVRLGTLFLGVALALPMGCSGGNQLPEVLKLEVEGAKSRNLTEVTRVVTGGHSGVGVTLPDLRRNFSVFRVVPKADAPVVGVGEVISSWYRLVVLEKLHESEMPNPWCPMPTPPDKLRLQPNEVALQLRVGRVTSRSVTIIQESPDKFVKLQPNTEYIAVLADCRTGAVTLPLGQYGLFEVQGSTLRSLESSNVGERPYFDQFLAIGNTAGLRAALR